MELEQLKAFVVIADQGSFSAAAETLFLTQPAISKRLAALERELEVRLFERQSRRIQLTHAGQTLLPKAREILLHAQDLKHLASQLQHQVSGTLKLGSSHHIGLHRLPPLLKAFRAHYPEVDLALHFLDSEAACRAVEQGHLELAFVTLPKDQDAGLIHLALWRDPLVFVVAHDHPLAQKNDLQLHDLSEYPAVLPEPHTYTRALLEHALQKAGCSIRKETTVNDLDTLKMLASINLGWSLLPQTLLDASLCVLDIDCPLERQLGLVVQSKRVLSNPARALIALSQAQIAT